MTTILSVRRYNQVVIGGDGQVSMGNTIIKGNAKKIHKLYKNQILAGFAGSTTDAFSLLETLESIIGELNGNLEKAVIKFAKEWRNNKNLRRLEAMLIVADKNKSFIVSGNGDVLQQNNDILSIGSGGNFALSSAIALYENTNLNAEEIVKKSLKIASNICVFTNENLNIESISY
ncbi:MAG: ATP-dependent protease subunit HslV [Succinivibrionaceae bacterium]